MRQTGFYCFIKVVLIIKLEKVFNKKTYVPHNSARVIILVGNTLSLPILHFYQVSSKYCEGYMSYGHEIKFKHKRGR